MRKTNEQFLIDLKERGNPIFEVLEEYQGCETPINVRCKKCNTIFKTTPHTLLKGGGCGFCSNKKVSKDFNSFGVNHPELLKFFIDPNEAYQHTIGSKKKAKLQCPICKNTYSIEYYRLNKMGFSCSFCNKMSYPNKFLRVFLTSFPEIKNLSFEKTFSIEKKIIRYDAYFEIANYQLLVEINGFQHYGGAFPNSSFQKQQEQDDFKKHYALINNFIYIVIDARKSIFSYIKNNILNSELNNYLPLENYDWNLLFNQLNDYSLLQNVCFDYENNLLRVSDLAKKYKLDRHSISILLQDGKELNLCPSYQLGKNRKGVSIEAYDSNNNFIGSFPSIKICADELNKIYDLNFLKNSISHVLSGAQKSHRNFYFKKVILNG